MTVTNGFTSIVLESQTESKRSIECKANQTVIDTGTQTANTMENQAQVKDNTEHKRTDQANVSSTYDVSLELQRLEEERQADLSYLARKYDILKQQIIACKAAEISRVANVNDVASSRTPNMNACNTSSCAKEVVQNQFNNFSLPVCNNAVYPTVGPAVTTNRTSEQHRQNSTYWGSHLRAEQIRARYAIPKELPTFSGKPEEWPIFISNYDSSTRICGSTNDENMLRLQRALKGKALEYVSSQLLLPDLVPEVIATLRMVFGRPEFIINSLLEKIRSAPSVNANKLDTLVSYSMEVRNLVSSMRAAGLMTHLDNPILLQELIDKLPARFGLDWALHCKYATGENLSDFSDWLFDLAQAASTILMKPAISSQQEVRRTYRVGFHEEEEKVSYTKNTEER